MPPSRPTSDAKLATFTQAAEAAIARHHLQDAAFNVMLVMCVAKPFEYTFRSGAMQGIVDRLVALAQVANKGEAAQIDVVAYSAKQKDLHPITLENFENYIASVTGRSDAEQKKRSIFTLLHDTVLGADLIEGLGDEVKAMPVLKELHSKIDLKASGVPPRTLVFFINDGQLCEEEGLFDEVNDHMSKMPAYFIFGEFETTGQNPALSGVLVAGYGPTISGGGKFNACVVQCGSLMKIPERAARFTYKYESVKIDDAAFYDSILAPFADWYN